MKDTQLMTRLQTLGMDRRKAAHITALIRDRIHPVAAVAAVRLREHHAGASGMSGYEYDQMSGLFSKIGHAFKKVVHAVGHTAGKVAKVAVPVLAAGGAAFLGFKAGTAIVHAIAGHKSNGQPVADATPLQASPALAAGGALAVPDTITQPATQLAAQNAAAGNSADVVALMQQLLAAQGTNMQSPAARQVLSDVGTQGVEATTAGPSSVPSWLWPAAAGVFALAFVLPAMNSGRGRRR